MNVYTSLKKRRRGLLVLVAFATVAMVTLAACSSNKDQSKSSNAGSSSTSDTAAPLIISIGKATLGEFLAGPNGRTLYVFNKDAPNTSNCKADCLPTWPPLLQEEGQSIKGDAAAHGTFGYVDTQAGEQVTYNGAPLYYFVGDAQPGDTKGHLVGGVWFVARPTTASTAVVGVGGSDSSAYLVGPTGNALYLFAKDTAGTSNCTGQCLDNWPALTVPAGLAPTAIKAAAGVLAVMTRTDVSTQQVTYNGKPLYYFAGDTLPGDTKGDGVGGVWSLARP